MLDGTKNILTKGVKFEGEVQNKFFDDVKGVLYNES